MSVRLATGIWVSAYLLRLRLADIPAYVTAKGDPTAGAVVVKLALLDGTARAYARQTDLSSDSRVWVVLAEGPEVEVDALLARERARDRDLWLIEIEDRAGRSLLDEDGLSDG
ncbi:MAG: GTP-binding protein Era [Rhodobacterales bacterium 12-65-15]|nr:MAG: GTP-binding protein Era [Rhodobacterales bacterium 12-65-15]